MKLCAQIPTVKRGSFEVQKEIQIA